MFFGIKLENSLCRYIFINKCFHSLTTHTGSSPGGGISQRPKEFLDRFRQPELTWFSPIVVVSLRFYQSNFID